MAPASSFLDQEKKGRLSDDPSASEASTSSAAPPPSYAHSRDASKPPPDYPDPGLVDPKTQLPKTFRVGSHDVAPLVNLQEVKAHLLLLGAFDSLKHYIVGLPCDPAVAKIQPPLDDDAKWALFVKRSAWRFEKYWKGLEEAREQEGPGEEFKEEELPPLDVLMAWHAYSLNPRVYHCDLVLRPSLSGMSSFPLLLITSQIDRSTLLFTHSPVQAETFSRLTHGLSPNLPHTTSFSDTLPVNCPACLRPNQVPWLTIPVPDQMAVLGLKGERLLKPKIGRGYAQKEFEAACGGCRLVFGRKQLELRKFANTLGRVKEELEGRRKGTGLLPGLTLEPVSGRPSTEQRILDLSSDIVTALSLSFPTPQNLALAGDSARLLQFYRGSMADIHQAFDVALRKQGLILKLGGLKKRLGKVWSYYNWESPFGVELVGAVLRQGSFIQKMTDLGWTQPHRFDENVFLPSRSIGRRVASFERLWLALPILELTRAPLSMNYRYHAFLDLMAAHPWTFVCPTLDIDLSWHTHQLKGSTYRTDVLLFVQQFVDHDDKVDENALDMAYRTTALAWQKRYGVPYSTCGCAPEAPKPPSLSFWKKDKKKETPLGDDWIDDEERDSSHPSVHSAVTLLGNRFSERKKRVREEIRSKRDEKAEKEWLKNNPGGDVKTRRQHNEDPYLTSPYMLYWGVGMPGAYPGGVAAWGMGGECSAHQMDGKNVSRGGCAVGAGVGGGGACGGGGCGGGCGGGGGGGGGGCGGGGGGGGGCGGGGS
ncbi:hypothetical protein BDY24DRAFT_417697 [Mrakia frigida]|uniref:uncharacterized protein n=1 Tax=Mrakia frigida TaxID=29902 RepID=UPI003FCBF587